ncbi:hypothetical protein Nepgr_002510 [Nepenthes gracilis]|uniref:Uncharacterized protein n=1 Tax=Nepenthes gracilis TaxID=150966 RepID=A0AAD3P6E1_NEPGR|nr:hypothetical protein Nepgr_002510 [Nepenthes gracilis]
MGFASEAEGFNVQQVNGLRCYAVTYGLGDEKRKLLSLSARNNPESSLLSLIQNLLNPSCVSIPSDG